MVRVMAMQGRETHQGFGRHDPMILVLRPNTQPNPNLVKDGVAMPPVLWIIHHWLFDGLYWLHIAIVVEYFIKAHSA